MKQVIIRHPLKKSSEVLPGRGGFNLPPSSAAVSAVHTHRTGETPVLPVGRLKSPLPCWVLVALILASLSFTQFCAAKKTEKKTPPPSSTYTTFKSSAGWQKLDLRFRNAWEDATVKGDSRRSFECLLKTKTKPSTDEIRQLSDAGFTSRSVIGKIMTGSIKTSDVPEVAALPFVQAMELAVPLSPK